MSRVILFNKPHGVLSQFSTGDGHPGLAAFIPLPGVYPAGRLDLDSEGLLLLTDNGRLQARISQPRYKLSKTYWVQVEGEPEAAQLARLSEGVELKDGRTRPARVKVMAEPDLWPRTPPVRFRRTVPTRWLELAISEGRNRQVRRMTAAVGLPTLRLVRVGIGNWSLGNLRPGEFRVEEVHLPGENSRPARTRRR